MRSFDSLDEREILALAISQEEEDARIYADLAENLKADYPATSEIFRVMVGEEEEHRRRLIETYRTRFGEHIPLIRKQDIRGFIHRRPVWLIRPLGIDRVRKLAESMEMETRQFYEAAMKRTTDAGVRELLGDLAAQEREHTHIAEELEKEKLTTDVRKQEEEARRRLFVLQVVQPGLAGLMDGSVSTLAPLFAAAFATHDSFDAFRVGLAASVGAGISMGFAEALSDDGTLTGRGHPWIRGIVCGLMTTLGGIGHTLPYLIPSFHLATTLAVIVVACELAAISYIRNHYMDTPFLSAAFQVVVGGALVFLAGILIGSA
ncbi:MAG TPA: ferritin family protein [Lacipirellulaceae bacterium]|nr:ferritin family protein [Lacipirellulaceae bacterium]